MEDDIDIYEDLPSFDAKESEKLKDEIKELSSKCENYRQDNTELQKKVTELEDTNKKIKLNLSSLLKTAKAEISRKDKMIADLRQQIDNAAFRRSGFVKKKPKLPEKWEKDKKFAPFVRLEVMPSQSQQKSQPESEDETVDTEQKYEPEKIASTVFGERLRKKILFEQETERIQKAEEKLAKAENEAPPVKPITENASNIDKKGPQEVIIALPEDVVAVNSKCSAPSSKASSTKSYEDDERSLSERQELSKKMLGKRLSKDDLRCDLKRRRLEKERHHSEDSRRYNGNVKNKDRLNGESSDNSRSSRDTAKRVDQRRGSNNRAESGRTRQVNAGRSISNYRSRSRTPGRRFGERRSDRHRTDKYRDYMDEYEKSRRNKRNTKQDNCGKIFKDLREKFEQNYKNQPDKDCKKTNRESPSSEKSRSSGKDETKGKAVDKTRGPERRPKSPERLASAGADESSSKQREGPKTRSKDRKSNAAAATEAKIVVEIEKSSTASSSKEVTNKEVAAAIMLKPQSSEKEVTNKRLITPPLLPDSSVSATVSKEPPTKKEEQLRERKGKSKDPEPTVTATEIQNSELKSQTQLKISCEKEETCKEIISTSPTTDILAVLPKSEDAPERMKKQSENTTLKSKESESTVTEAKDVDSETRDIDSQTKSEAPASTSSKEEIKNKEVTSFEPLTQDLALELQCDKSPNVQKDLSLETPEFSPAAVQIVKSSQDDSGKWISAVLENSAEVSFTSLEVPQPEIGSRSFREEKIENIEKFILNYQDDENYHCKGDRENSADLEYENKSCNSTSSILDALSMDVDDVGVVRQGFVDNSLSERLLLESLSTPVKKRPSFPPENEAKQPPLPPTPQENEIKPPLPPTSPPEDIKQSLSLLPAVIDEKQSQPPLIEKEELLPPLPSPDTRQNPPLPPGDTENQVLPPLPSLDEKKQTLPPIPSSETKQSPPLPPERTAIVVSPPLSLSDEKNTALPPFAAPDSKQNSPLPPADTENQALPSPPSSDKEKQRLLSIAASDEKRQSIAVLSAQEKINPSLVATPEEKLSLPENKSDVSSSSQTYLLLSTLLPVPADKKDSSSTESPAPVDENMKTAPMESSKSKPEPENAPTEKIALKQSGRPRIPCIPIVSRYSRKRRDMVLTDCAASRCIVKSKSPGDLETNNNATAVKASQIITKELKVTLSSITHPAIQDKSAKKSNDLNPELEKLGKKSAVVSKSTREKISETESEIAIKVLGETEKKSSPSEIVSPLVSGDKIANSKKPQRNAEQIQPKVESKADTLPKIQKSDSNSEPKKSISPKVSETQGTRSALKTIASTPSDEDLGVLSSRKKPSPKEKENQTKEVAKQSRITVVARRRRPVNLEDSSTAMTVVSSVQNMNRDASSTTNASNNVLANGQKSSATNLSTPDQNLTCNVPPKKNNLKNSSPNSEKQEVVEPSSKRRKRRSAEKR